MKKKTYIVNDMLRYLLVIILIIFFALSSSVLIHAQEPKVGTSIDPLWRFLYTILSVDEFITRIPNAPTTNNQDNPNVIIDQSGKMVTITPGPTVILDEKLNRLPGGKVTFYCQGNTQWQNVCSLGAAGCGPTSMAMALSGLGIFMSPPQVDAVFRQRNWRSCGDYGSFMTDALFSDWLPSLGLKSGDDLSPNGILDLQSAKNVIDASGIIIASSRSFPCVNCKSATRIDHIFVVDDVDTANGLVSIRDPNNCSYIDGNDEIAKNVWRSVSEFPWLYAIPITKL